MGFPKLYGWWRMLLSLRVLPPRPFQLNMSAVLVNSNNKQNQMLNIFMKRDESDKHAGAFL